MVSGSLELHEPVGGGLSFFREAGGVCWFSTVRICNRETEASLDFSQCLDTAVPRAWVVSRLEIGDCVGHRAVPGVCLPRNLLYSASEV